MDNLSIALINNDINKIRLLIAEISCNGYVHYYCFDNNISKYVKLLNICNKYQYNYKKLKFNLRNIKLKEK